MVGALLRLQASVGDRRSESKELAACKREKASAANQGCGAAEFAGTSTSCLTCALPMASANSLGM